MCYQHRRTNNLTPNRERVIDRLIQLGRLSAFVVWLLVGFKIQVCSGSMRDQAPGLGSYKPFWPGGSEMNSFISRSGRMRGIAFQNYTRFLGMVLGTFLLCLPAFSQGSFGRILGGITDQSGGVVSGATVTVVDTQRGTSRTLTTHEAGEYNAPTLIPGTYTVRAEAKGFKVLNRENVVLEVGKEVRVDLTPQPGEQTQTVTVTEALPLVDA